jgi:hypothetical protein
MVRSKQQKIHFSKHNYYLGHFLKKSFRKLHVLSLNCGSYTSAYEEYYLLGCDTM